MNPYKPRLDGKPRNVSGFFRATREGNYIALAAAWNKDPRKVIYHEYFHYFMHSNFAPQPTWYDEGAAEFYSTFRSSSNEAEIGHPVEEHLRTLRDSRMLPLSELFTVGKDSPEYNDVLKQGIFYAESWALVHYLLRADSKRSAEFGRFLVRLQQGEPADEAFRREFGTEPDTLQRELYNYVRQARFQYARIRFSELDVPTTVSVSPLRPEDAIVQLGDLLAHGDQDELADAEAHFESVLAKSPAHPGALAGRGFCRLRARRFDEAAEDLGKALDAGSTDFRVAYRLGEVRLRRVGYVASGPTPARELEEARVAFRRSLELNPGFSEARAALGKTFLRDDASRAREGVPFLEAAVRELPGRADLVRELASLYERAGDTERGEELERSLEKKPKPPRTPR
jgi:tetratricopeptide (TPR) repeat protein